MIAQDAFAFGAPLDHSRAITSPRETQILIRKWFGIPGESHLTSPPGGREIVVECIWTGASEAALRATKQAIEAVGMRLFGDLAIQQTGGQPSAFPQCTFLGVRSEDPQPEPNYGWSARGVLRWRQSVAPVPGGS